MNTQLIIRANNTPYSYSYSHYSFSLRIIVTLTQVPCAPLVLASSTKKEKVHRSWTAEHFWITVPDQKWSKNGHTVKSDRLLVCKIKGCCRAFLNIDICQSHTDGVFRWLPIPVP